MNRYINENDKKMDELLQKYIAGNASEKESQRIMEWLREDEQHLREYKRQRKLYDITLWQTKSPVDIQQEKKDPLRRVLDVIVRIAAVIVFTVATTYFYTHHVLQDKEENMQTVVVPAGQHAELYLADGTHVWLNSGSRLTFPGRFSKKVRHVELDGEGYFTPKFQTFEMPYSYYERKFDDARYYFVPFSQSMLRDYTQLQQNPGWKNFNYNN